MHPFSKKSTLATRVLLVRPYFKSETVVEVHDCCTHSVGTANVFVIHSPVVTHTPLHMQTHTVSGFLGSSSTADI